MSGNHSPMPSGFFAAVPKTSSRQLPPPPPPPGSGFYQQQFYYGNVTQKFNHHIPAPTNSSMHAMAQPEPKRYKQDRSSFHCDACNLTVDSLTALDAHKASHIKCEVCMFEAAPKVVKGHFQATHGKFSGSGFKSVTIAIPGCPVQTFRICVGNRPEDVQKWIEERKKRFPRTQHQQKETVEKKGLSSLLDGYGSSSDDDEDGHNRQEKRSTLPQESVNKVTNDHKNGPETSQPNLKRPCHAFMRYGKCKRGSNCPYSHDIPVKTHNNRSGRKSLLEKLLVNDKRRETTFTLQLLEYLVDTNFLTKAHTDNNDPRRNGLS